MILRSPHGPAWRSDHGHFTRKAVTESCSVAGGAAAAALTSRVTLPAPACPPLAGPGIQPLLPTTTPTTAPLFFVLTFTNFEHHKLGSVTRESLSECAHCAGSCAHWRPLQQTSLAQRVAGLVTGARLPVSNVDTNMVQ